jgi:hypothetical protein
MNRRKNLVMIGLVALVAGAAALVYAQEDETAGAPQSEKAAEETASPAAGDDAVTGQKSAQKPKVLYDLAALPDPVQRMLRKIIIAAESGDMEAMRPVLESRELKPMVAAAYVSDPIAYWKEHSVDGTGRDILAAMLNVLSSGFVLTGKGESAAYVWPYFAEVDLKTLTPAQEVEFYRAVPPKRAAAMKKSGEYRYYRLGISPSGVWHYFIQ